MHDRPIGMFDSGFGGLTVARALIDLLPAEHLVYVGDTGRYPYGSRPLSEVRDFAHEISGWLIDEHDVKFLIVACNTAAAAALDELQAELAVPVVGVIDPGVRSLVVATRSGRVGVIGTVGTISSGAYQETIAEVAPEVTLTCAACPGFVEFVERGETTSEQVHVLAERLLAPIVDADVDALLLGCTHYPFLARTISDVMGRDVVLVSSADETAFMVRSMLEGSALARPPDAGDGTRQWFSSGDVETFRRLGNRLLGPELDRAAPGTVGSVTLTITVLGASGTYPEPFSACSGYLLRTDTTSVWLDCGSGTLANLQRHVALPDLDGVVCSHSHPDHWLELPVLVNALRYGLHLPERGLPVYWTAETARLFETISGRPPEPTFDAAVIAETSRVTIGDIDLTFSRTDHPVETLAVRADAGGRTIAYSADTGNAWELSSLGPGIDVAVIEATLDEHEPGRVQHLTASEAGSQAARAGVASLVLTHLAPGSDPAARMAAAAAAFDGPIAVARIDERY